MRFAELTAWTRQYPGLATALPVPASTDASFRRYFRVQGDVSCIVMDAPPPQEDCRPFVRIAGHLEQMGLNSPRVLQADLERGYLLLSDLGSTQYLSEMKARPERASLLYRDAIDALLQMHAKGCNAQSAVPAYSEALLRTELSLFRDWLCERHLHLRFSTRVEKEWQTCCDMLVMNALQQPRVFVHRDFHSRNLMVTDSNNPGVLDFQDAVAGPLTYDLVSLLKDCYIRWPAEQTIERAQYFYENSSVAARTGREEFLRNFDLMGVQRHLKAAGIFARLLHRDGKSGYLQDVPRTLAYIVDIAPQYAELGFLGNYISRNVLPSLREAS